MTTNALTQLLEKMAAGNEVALARLMTLVERDGNEVGPILAAIAPKLGTAFTIGITGPPGAGKSSVVDRLAVLMRQAGKTVGVVAVDPSSPFSGGALLGDRIRMTQHYLDKGVFIRSMATRGSHGGLARATKDVIKLLDASGWDYVLVETVGVGQTELDVMGTTDTVIVTLVPEAGDGVQVMKAGLMEIADIFLVNKADRDGANRMLTELNLMLELKYSGRGAGEGAPQWKIPVLAAQAVNNVGMTELFQAIESHRQFLVETGELERRRKARRREELLSRVEYEVRRRLTAKAGTDPALTQLLEEVGAGKVDPYTASARILGSELLKNGA
ncbi:MAG TPA: methylmalonyl Co-A mutase-associated GTPase MeaB [Candidatus Binatia bacterium]|nr:methylmalonyl Co-A mutase-associated GTPase MeaB [Candidatus Binatia bacterium]